MSWGGDRNPHNIKLVTIGDSSVGKSCLISQFCDDNFNSNVVTTTIAIDYRIKKGVEIDGSKYKLLIWDTAGQERFRAISTSFFRGCHGILLVYDITQRNTFENIRNHWIGQIKDYIASLNDTDEDDNKICLILLGNKCDMVDDRQVASEEAQMLAKELQIKFMETSAKKNINVEEAFLYVANERVKTLAPHQSISKRESKSKRKSKSKVVTLQSKNKSQSQSQSQGQGQSQSQSQSQSKGVSQSQSKGVTFHVHVEEEKSRNSCC